jgi:hypothetical protein
VIERGRQRRRQRRRRRKRTTVQRKTMKTTVGSPQHIGGFTYITHSNQHKYDLALDGVWCPKCGLNTQSDGWGIRKPYKYLTYTHGADPHHDDHINNDSSIHTQLEPQNISQFQSQHCPTSVRRALSRRNKQLQWPVVPHLSANDA